MGGKGWRERREGRWEKGIGWHGRGMEAEEGRGGEERGGNGSKGRGREGKGAGLTGREGKLRRLLTGNMFAW
jgi:hypothetical protein